MSQWTSEQKKIMADFLRKCDVQGRRDIPKQFNYRHPNILPIHYDLFPSTHRDKLILNNNFKLEFFTDRHMDLYENGDARFDFCSNENIKIEFVTECVKRNRNMDWWALSKNKGIDFAFIEKSYKLNRFDVITGDNHKQIRYAWEIGDVFMHPGLTIGFVIKYVDQYPRFIPKMFSNRGITYADVLIFRSKCGDSYGKYWNTILHWFSSNPNMTAEIFKNHIPDPEFNDSFVLSKQLVTNPVLDKDIQSSIIHLDREPTSFEENDLYHHYLQSSIYTPIQSVDSTNHFMDDTLYYIYDTDQRSAFSFHNYNWTIEANVLFQPELELDFSGWKEDDIIPPVSEERVKELGDIMRRDSERIWSNKGRTFSAATLRLCEDTYPTNYEDLDYYKRWVMPVIFNILKTDKKMNRGHGIINATIEYYNKKQNGISTEDPPMSNEIKKVIEERINSIKKQRMDNDLPF